MARIAGAASSAILAASASANTYLGGPWNQASSWLNGAVPDRATFVEFNEAPGGIVPMGAGGQADEIVFHGDTQYTLIGEPNALLRARRIANEGPANTVSVAVLRGANVDAQHGVLEIDAGGTYYDGDVARLTITSNIINARDPEYATSGSAATDVYANGSYTGLLQNTGKTKFFGATRLYGVLGQSLASSDVTLSRGRVVLDSSVGYNDNRLSDAALVTLDGADLSIVGDPEQFVNERVLRVNVGAGASGMGFNNSTLSSNGSLGLTRDEAARGTLRLHQVSEPLALAPAAVLGGEAIVPYVVMSSGFQLRPARYDPGDDEIRGTSDDLGFLTVFADAFTTATLTHESARLDSARTLNGSTTISTLSIDDNGSLSTGVSALTLSAGVLCINRDGDVLTGSGPINAPAGVELVIANRGNNVAIRTPLNGNNGLTLSNYGDFGYGGNTFANVTLAAANGYIGQTTVNFGRLTLGTSSALPVTSALRLTDAEVAFDFTPGGAIPNRIIFDGSTNSASGERSTFIRDLTFKEGQTFTFTGSFEGRGAYFLRGAGATLLVNTPAGTAALASSPAGEFSLWPNEGTTLRIDGQLGDGTRSTGSVVQFGGATVGKGRLTGGFQLSRGTLSPGSNGAAGTAVLRMKNLGYYGGEGHFEINGTQRGTQYDALDVDETLLMSGEGKIVIENTGYVGLVGQRFELMHYTGQFRFGTATLVNPLATQAGAQWVQIYTESVYTLAVAGPTGDATLDGRVNFDDLLTLAKHYNQSDQTWLTGDFTGDGTVNFDDLLQLAKKYNTAVPGLTPMAAFDAAALADTGIAADWAIAQSLVPEPSAMLTGLLLIGPSIRRRRP